MPRFLASLILSASAAAAGEYPTLPIGAAAPDFALRGADGKVHSLKDYASANLLAVAFTCNSCPQSILAEDAIQKLYQAYRSKGLSNNSNF